MEELGGIGTFLEGDHDEIDRIFARYQRSKDDNDNLSKSVFSEFDERLRRHIDWEEEFLSGSLVFKGRSDCPHH